MRSVTRRAAAAVAAGGLILVTSSPARADWLTDLANPFEAALSSESYLLALVLIYAAGLVTSLTPCVYPMIAITVSVFGASEAKSRTKAAGLSTMYVLGIAVPFAVLGVAAGLLRLDSSQLYANAWFWVVGAALLFALALGMFGVYELRLPMALQNRLGKMGGLGPKGAFALGMAGGLIASPCTGPVLGGLLMWIGATGNAAFGALALAVFAFGLGTLTWVVGTFAVSLPKSGRWMEAVKHSLGLVLVVTALFFLFNNAFGELGRIVERTPGWLVSGFALLAVGVAMGGIHLSAYGATRPQLARKIVGLASAAVGALGVVLWLNAAPVLPEGAEIAWMDDYDAARALAQAEGRPLMVDFGASWCGACEELDRHTFSDPRVVQEGQRFVPVRVDLSPGPNVTRGRELLATYDQRGLPLVVLHDEAGDEAARVTSFVEAEQMLQLMRSVR